MSSFKLLAALFACFLYPVAATLNPQLGKSPLAILILTLLLILIGLRLTLSRNPDIFEPIKVIGFYFAVIFVLAPLGTSTLQWQYTRPFHEILPSAASFALAAFVAVLIGYESAKFVSKSATSTLDRESLPVPGNRVLRAAGLAFFAVGFVGYLILFIRAGGLATILFSDTNRTEFFLDFGYLFWFASFMFPGAVLLFAGMTRRDGIAAYGRYFPAAIVFVLFILLQGRSRSLNALVLVAFASHYLIREIKITQLARWGVVLTSVALFVGVARSGSVRSYAISEPLAIVGSILSNLPEMLSGFLVNDISRLRQIAIIIDKVPDLQPYDWGSSLFIFLNPWIRLVGLDHLTIEPIGTRLFHLALPHLPHTNTGLLPSMPGEMLFNFPWYLAIFPFILYGLFLRIMYERLILADPTLTSVALYSTLMTWTAQFLLSAVGKSIFEMMIWIAPLILAGLLAGAARRPNRNPPVGADSGAWGDQTI